METLHTFRLAIQPGQSKEALFDLLAASGRLFGAVVEVAEVVEVRTDHPAIVGILNELAQAPIVSQVEHQFTQPLLPAPGGQPVETGVDELSDAQPVEKTPIEETSPAGDPASSEKPRLPERKCRVCGEPFTPRRADQRRCSTKCKPKKAAGKAGQIIFPEGMEWFDVNTKAFYTEPGMNRALLTGKILAGGLFQNRKGEFFFTQVGAGFKMELVQEKKLAIQKSN